MRCTHARALLTFLLDTFTHTHSLPLTHPQGTAPHCAAGTIEFCVAAHGCVLVPCPQLMYCLPTNVSTLIGDYQYRYCNYQYSY